MKLLKNTKKGNKKNVPLLSNTKEAGEPSLLLLRTSVFVFNFLI